MEAIHPYTHAVTYTHGCVQILQQPLQATCFTRRVEPRGEVLEYVCSLAGKSEMLDQILNTLYQRFLDKSLVSTILWGSSWETAAAVTAVTWNNRNSLMA